jgi:choline dehydrogenase-like flavoprotein
MDQSGHYDLIVIGSGAGGATVAQALADTGKRILILERGEHLPREADNWSAEAVFINGKYRTDEKWLDKDNKEFTPNTHYWVGGNTTFYGGVLMRFREGDFEERQHEGGVSPAWPISYGELSPWYDKAEALWRVRGEAGVDPCEPPRNGPYAHAPVGHEPEIARLDAHLKENMGWKPFPLPLGVMRDDADPVRSACVRCQFCGGYPCLVKAKSDARTISIDPLLDAENVTILTGRMVDRLEVEDCGSLIREVVCTNAEGQQERYKSDLVVLAAGAANSAAVLLRSTCEGHPNGLANGSDQVGRNYMFHTMTAIVSLTAHSVDADFPKTLGINDFYWGDPDGSYDYPMGHVQTLEYMKGETIEGQIKEMLPPSLIPDFISRNIAKRMLSFLVLSEDLPLSENRIRWDGKQIHLEYTYNNLEGHKRLVAKMDNALDNFADENCKIWDHHYQVSQLLPIYGTAHQCGTARMGDDPATSVVNRDCRAHEVSNLFITDTSVFCSSAAVNPTLTLVANALRVSEVIRKRLMGAEPLAPVTELAQTAEAPPKQGRKKFLGIF